MQTAERECLGARPGRAGESGVRGRARRDATGLAASGSLHRVHRGIGPAHQGRRLVTRATHDRTDADTDPDGHLDHVRLRVRCPRGGEGLVLALHLDRTAHRGLDAPDQFGQRALVRDVAASVGPQAEQNRNRLVVEGAGAAGGLGYGLLVLGEEDGLPVGDERGPGGRISGQGQWRTGTLDLVLQLTDLQPARLDGRAAALTLSELPAVYSCRSARAEATRLAGLGRGPNPSNTGRRVVRTIGSVVALQPA